MVLEAFTGFSSHKTVITPSLPHEEKPSTSPWDELKANSVNASNIHASFHQFFTVGINNFIPLNDQKHNGISYVCRSMSNADSIKKASIWLDSTKWNNSLQEFADLAREICTNSCLLIIAHQPEPISYLEYILMKPVSIDSGDFYRANGHVYRLTISGQVSIGNVDLGYLDQSRVGRETVEHFKTLLVKSK